MRLRSTLTLALLLLLGGGFALALHAVPPDPVPETLEPKAERTAGPPLWISAEAATDSATVLDWDLLDESGALRQVVERQQATLGKAGLPGAATGDLTVRWIPASECEVSLDMVDGRGGELPSRNLEDLVESSRAILSGVVRSVDPGFSFGIPAALLTVEVTQVLKGAPELAGQRIYVDHQVAHFAIGPYRFCNAGKGFEPRVGDRALLFDYTGPVDRDGRLYAPRPEQVLFETGAGGLFVPERIREDRDLARSRHLVDVVAAVRKRLERGVGR